MNVTHVMLTSTEFYQELHVLSQNALMENILTGLLRIVSLAMNLAQLPLKMENTVALNANRGSSEILSHVTPANTIQDYSLMIIICVKKFVVMESFTQTQYTPVMISIK